MRFNRFESSVDAFRETLKRLEKIHGLFVKALDEGFVPAGADAQALLYESDHYDESVLMEELQDLSGKYDLEDFEAEKLREHLEADRDMIRQMIALVAPIKPDKDAKLQTLISKLEDRQSRELLPEWALLLLCPRQLWR